MLTGKGLTYGGSLARTEATGYGLLLLHRRDARPNNGMSFEGKTVVISGSGNVAIYAAEKATQLGAKVVAMSDSNGYVYDAEGIDLAADQGDQGSQARPRQGVRERSVPAPSIIEGQRHLDHQVRHRAALRHPERAGLQTTPRCWLHNGCMAVAEGANMPTTPEAIEIFQEHGVLFAPGKAANAGGVATSALEMSQNSQRLQLDL